ncbi:MAG TPA: NFACT RNA binding domain-containing protein [Chthonomonadaceae bacterium]|nr:NFACT RNA binding domain-containing protein [Chthonomonadaceae bacterium]
MNAPAPNKPPKIPFDSLTLRVVVAELRRQLIGGQIQDMRQPTPTELLLGVRSQGRSFLLLLSADARLARAHLTATRRPNPPTPPNFCMLLRKWIVGYTIRDIRQRDFDRVLEIEVASRQEGEPTTVTLIAELMGKHSNLILVNAHGTVLDAAKRITHRINRQRETLPGLPYQPPPEPAGKADPFAPDALERALEAVRALPEVSEKTLARRLLETFMGMSPFLAGELAARAAEYLIPRPPSLQGKGVAEGFPQSNGMTESSSAAGVAERLRAAWEAVFGAAAREAYAPVLVWDENGQPVGAYPFPLLQWPAEAQQPVPDLNLALDTAFTAAQERAELEAVAGELRGKIAREIKRLEHQRQSVERTGQEAARAEEYKQNGELILANLWRIHPGETAVTVQDYFDPALPDRTIPLDPQLSPQENAEACFRRYRKARDGQEAAREYGARIEAALSRLQEAQARLEALETAEAARDLRAELVESGLLRESAEEAGAREAQLAGPDLQGHKIRRLVTPEGYEIFIGETATANDFLITRLAAPNDIWLHVRAAASAHVLIRTHGRPDAVPRSVLEQAARLCARHSSQKHSSLVAVDYTLKKYVRKPRGAAPGSADYHHETTLEVTP